MYQIAELVQSDYKDKYKYFVFGENKQPLSLSLCRACSSSSIEKKKDIDCGTAVLDIFAEQHVIVWHFSSTEIIPGTFWKVARGYVTHV